MALINNKMDFIRNAMAKYFGCDEDELYIKLVYHNNGIYKITAISDNLPQENATFFFEEGESEEVRMSFDFNPDFVMKVC